MQSLTIGRLAGAAGVNLETLRYYERIGLMTSPPRTASGHRAYEREHLRRLIFIRRARELGFCIEDIRSLLALAEPARSSCAEVRVIADRHLEAVRLKIADLNSLEAVLCRSVSQCSDNPASSCHLIDLLSSFGQTETEGC